MKQGVCLSVRCVCLSVCVCVCQSNHLCVCVSPASALFGRNTKSSEQGDCPGRCTGNAGDPLAWALAVKFAHVSKNSCVGFKRKTRSIVQCAYVYIYIYNVPPQEKNTDPKLISWHFAVHISREREREIIHIQVCCSMFRASPEPCYHQQEQVDHRNNFARDCLASIERLRTSIDSQEWRDVGERLGVSWLEGPLLGLSSRQAQRTPAILGCPS